MALEMKPICEKCQNNLPKSSQEALICSYECTFCLPCAEEMKMICPNCGGNLQLRPTRIAREVFSADV